MNRVTGAVATALFALSLVGCRGPLELSVGDCFVLTDRVKESWDPPPTIYKVRKVGHYRYLVDVIDSLPRDISKSDVHLLGHRIPCPKP